MIKTDATNSTKARRDAIANVDVKVASGDPDYDGMPREKVREDFLRRIQHYESHYKTIDDKQLSYCKFVNVGYEVTINRINNYLSSRVAFYLMNLYVTPRLIFFTRRGLEYAKALPALIANSISDAPLTVWTSTLKRTIQMAGDLPYPKLTWKSLDKLDAGVCDGMTYEEIKEHYPEDYAQRDDDKFNYRYRGGESYRDVVVRLEPVIMELERQENILIVCHQVKEKRKRRSTLRPETV
ncbi:histidine phosphatase superfamily [Phakopsora pachyrhizi]|uniref:Histidine phosphatase superfamily n=1 Tax=Phakopsora pachyrhizi TaxID=170000 RepID=A0AAV0AW57_PHAPC|nr:histidine phosphatase superfamily [Phakopsora pachyrhizi]